jgi:hypothetical protein
LRAAHSIVGRFFSLLGIHYPSYRLYDHFPAEQGFPGALREDPWVFSPLNNRSLGSLSIKQQSVVFLGDTMFYGNFHSLFIRPSPYIHGLPSSCTIQPIFHLGSLSFLRSRVSYSHVCKHSIYLIFSSLSCLCFH